MSTPTHVLWLDMEATDVDPYAPHAAILEVGAIITDWSPQLTEIGRASLLIRPPGTQQDHDLMWSRMLPVIQQMHQNSGLWREATTSEDAWDLVQADRAIAHWVTETTGNTDPLPLAGSGVGHMDLPWTKVYLPHLAQRLTYWPLDTGHQRRLLQLAGRDDLVDLAGDVDAKPHRGIGDVELHVAEARRYLALLGSIPAAGTPVHPTPPGPPSPPVAPPGVPVG